MAEREIVTEALARVEGEGAMHVRAARRAGRGRAAADLRAAALLRGVPARPALHRGARHHRADLRHLPGRLPDELDRGDGGRLRRRGRREPSAPCAGSCTAASGSRATRCTSSCSTRPTSSATRARSRWRATTASSSSARCAQEGGQRAHARRRRPRDPPGQRARRRLLPRARRAPSWRRWSSELEAAREFAREAVRLDRRAAVPGLRGGLRVRRAAPTATRYAIEGGRLRVEHAASTSRRPSTRSTSSRSRSPHSTALHSRLRDGGAPTSSGRSPATRSTATGSRRSAREAADAAGPRAGLPQPVPQHRRARVEILYALDEALRLIEAYEPPDPPAVEVAAARGDRATAGARRRAACSGTATRSTPTGTILDAKIVPPTSQNQAPHRAEPARLRRSATPTSPTTSCSLRCEQAIRSYDPCISCATHFLRLEVDRGVIVIGVGNAWRGDDAAGLAVARRVRGARGASSTRATAPRAASTLWAGARRRRRRRRRRVGRRAGHRAPLRRARRAAARAHAALLDARLRRRRTPSSWRARSGACPARLDVYAIEGANFSAGDGLSPAVERAVDELAASLASARR